MGRCDACVAVLAVLPKVVAKETAGGVLRVFVINTKTLSTDVWVGDDNVLAGGHRKPFVEKQEAEAKCAREKLVSATRRRSLWVQRLLVFVESRLTVKEPQANVVVLRANELVP